MQLIVVSIVLFFLVVSQELKAQFRKSLAPNNSNLVNSEKTELKLDLYEKPDWQAIDIDFLSSYYEQDGNNAAVTGGIGTEQLTDFTQKVLLKIPATQRLQLNMDAGYDYYSSASTDNIDNIRGSASSHDVRIHGNIGLTYDLENSKTIGLRIGGSQEYDYTSLNGGLNFGWQSEDANTAIDLGAQAFIDQWEFYFPRDVRRQDRRLPTNKRQSYNTSVGITQVLNKKMQFSLQAEGILMKGLLSTPFHRVYFQEQNAPKVEQLPDQRLKIPIGLRLNTHLSEWLISRMYYRYYWDDWGVQGHTASIELPIKISRFVSVYPTYRYHRQTAADYFLPYKQHNLADPFYTSDYDLAALNSHSFGLGMTISPIDGFARMKLPLLKNTAIIINGIDIKYSHYRRSTGLNANIVSLGINIAIR